MLIHLPPPINGVTLIGESVIESEKLKSNYNILIIPIRSATSLADKGKFRISKIYCLISTIIALVFKCIRFSPIVIYFTLTPNGVAFYRDLFFVIIMKLFRIRRKIPYL